MGEICQWSWRSFARVVGVEDERAAEAGKLSTLVVGIYNALVNLRMMPIWGIA
jgi:hypothetical protein